MRAECRRVLREGAEKFLREIEKKIVDPMTKTIRVDSREIRNCEGRKIFKQMKSTSDDIKLLMTLLRHFGIIT